MSTISQPMWPRVSRSARQLAASFVGTPTCALCGRGHAQTGWHLDPMGLMHGRCPGCIDDTSASAAIPKLGLPPAN